MSNEVMIEKYKKFRADQILMNARLLDALPKGVKGNRMIYTAAREIGYRVVKQEICFPDEYAVDRLYDFLIYEPIMSGKSVAQKFYESSHDISATEKVLLQAMIASKTSLFEVVDVDRPGKRFLLHDLLDSSDDIWLTDINFSSTVLEHIMFFARIFTIDDISFTSGASVCFIANDKEFLLKRCAKLKRIKNTSIRSRKRYALFMELEKYSQIKTLYE